MLVPGLGKLESMLMRGKPINIHLEELKTLLDKTKVAELVDALDLGSSS